MVCLSGDGLGMPRVMMEGLSPPTCLLVQLLSFTCLNMQLRSAKMGVGVGSGGGILETILITGCYKLLYNSLSV